MDFIEACKIRFYDYEYLKTIDSIVKEKINSDLDIKQFELLHLFDSTMTNTPSLYWNKDVYQQTYRQLEKLASNNKLIIDEEIIDYFFIALNTYTQITDTINDLSLINDSNIIKNRQYRLPTYNSIVEGCITNLFKHIALIINQTTEKDYSGQSKLNPLCEILKNSGFNKAVEYVDIDIRNSINHGGVVFLEDGNEIEFRYNKQHQNTLKKLKAWDFERLIDCVYDVASALILALASFYNNHWDIIDVDINSKNNNAFNFISLKLSNEHLYCEYINDVENNKQINVNMYTAITDREILLQDAISLCLLVYDLYGDYEKYLIGFRNERMSAGFVRFTNKQISDIAYQIREMSDVVNEIIHKKEILIYNPSTENLNLHEIKYFRFPNYSDGNLTITQICDASLPERKRLRCNIFIGEVCKKEDILLLVNKAIEWLKKLKNVDSPTLHHKSGNMEADSLYINVYKNLQRREKEILPTNENFVCMVDYNIDGETTLVNGGIFKSIWDQLYKEKIGKIQFAWRESKYIQRTSSKIPVNSLCPCGSGKKFKKCCMRKAIYN